MERKRRCLEPDSLEEQEMRKSFEVEYNRSFDTQEGGSFDGVTKQAPKLQHSEDAESNTSFETELLTLRETDRPSFDLPEEDHFLRERAKFFEGDSLEASFDEGGVPPPLPPKKTPRRGKSPNVPSIFGESFDSAVITVVQKCIPNR